MSESIIIVARKPGILFISICSLLAFIVLFSTVLMLHSQRIINIETDIIARITVVIIVSLATPLWYIYIYFSSVRYWLLFYSINWSVSMNKDKWYMIIVPDENNKDWYLCNRDRYGSWSWIKKKLIYIISLFCTYSITCFIVISVFQLSFSIITLLLSIHIILIAFIPLIFCIIIQCKIPAYDDNIGLREELKFCNFIFISIVVIYIIYTAIFMSHRQIFENNISLSNIFWSSMFFVVRIGIFLANLKQTRWPLKRFESVLKSYSTQTIVDLAHQKTSARIAIEEQKQLTPSNASPTVSHSIRRIMRNALRDHRIFRLFMQRLLKEHCSECLLSIIEFVQFQNKCYGDFHAYDDDFIDVNGDISKGLNCGSGPIIINDASNESVTIELKRMFPRIPSNISNSELIDLPNDDTFPKSSIVYKPNHKPSSVRLHIKDYKIIARELYKKYIRVESEYEINIDGFRRRWYKKLFENETEWLKNKKYNDYQRLCSVFNACVEQMTTLITASFVTWRNSAEYKRIKAQIIN
eukprot:36925_1